MRSTDILPFAVEEATLANGLRVIVVPTGFPNIVSLQIPVQTGSRNEVEPGRSGFAHFFEHMMFRGTARYPAAAYQEIITRTGARQNAYTTDDYTNYHLTFAAEDLDTILMLEADRFMNLEYSTDDFRTEARAVLGEYNKSSANPITKLIEVQREHAFTVHPYRHTTMGFLRDIEAMPNQAAYARQFFSRWYRPSFTTVVVAGDLQPAQVFRRVEQHWGAWQPGGSSIAIPREPEPATPVHAHVPWPSSTLPLVTVAFHGPAFSEVESDYVALTLVLDLHFGETSELYRRLVETEQLADQLFVYQPATADPSLATILARVKRPEDTPAVREAILATVARAVHYPVAMQRLADAKARARYGFARTLDNSEAVASALARFVRFRRSAATLNALFQLYEPLTPNDLQQAAQRYLRHERMVLTTLSHEALPAAMATVPPLVADAPRHAATAATPEFVVQRSPSTLLRFKLLFTTGSSHDPNGKAGLAALTAAMIAEAGSEDLRIDEISRALYPMAGSFEARTDKEMTVFTGVVHRDNLDRFAGIVLPQLLHPGLRETDFSRLQQSQLNALVQDLRESNDEELGKERLQTNLFAGTPYGHPVLGTVAGIGAIALGDVQRFMAAHYARAALTVGVAGDVPERFLQRLRDELGALPAGSPAAAPALTAHQPRGIEVELIAKETRATAISFGHPIAVTRSHEEFAALWLARAWLGEHRSSMGRLYLSLREARGLNYGDYAYIEAFPRGMYQFFPEPNLARRAQIFEVWIRPVPPEHALFALKLALHELRGLIERGLSAQEFAASRDYLMKNIFVMTQTGDQQLGYALDSRWYGIGEFTTTMRQRLHDLSRDAVNAAVRRHLSSENLSVVMVTKDAAALRDQLLADAPTTISYDAGKPQELLDEDRAAGAVPLSIRPDAIRITPVEEVFAR